MQLGKVYIGDHGLQIDLTLVTSVAFDTGVVALTPRWHAMGLQLLSNDPIKEVFEQKAVRPCELTEVRAGVIGTSRRYQQTQNFQLTFKVIE